MVEMRLVVGGYTLLFSKKTFLAAIETVLVRFHSRDPILEPKFLMPWVYTIQIEYFLITFYMMYLVSKWKKLL